MIEVRPPNPYGYRRQQAVGPWPSGGSSFTPPAPPPVAGYSDWLASRQINLVAPYNPLNEASASPWHDLSTNADVFNSITGGSFSPPTYATNILNGKPVVKFTGFQAFRGTNNFVSGANAWSVVFVSAAGTAQQVLLGGAANTTTNVSIQIASGTGTVTCNGVNLISGAVAAGSINIVTYDGSVVRWLSAGVVVGVGATTFNLTAAAIQIGSPVMQLFELVAYPLALSIDQMNSLGAAYAALTLLAWSTYVWEPGYIKNQLGIWLDADDGTLTTPVASRTDLSGNVGAYTQGTVINQPALVTNATSTGKSALQGAATASLIAGSATPLTSGTTNYSVFLVSYNPTVSKAVDQVVASIKASGGGEMLLYKGNVGATNYWAQRSTTGGRTFPTAPFDSWNIECLSAGIYYINGVSGSTGAYSHGGSGNGNALLSVSAGTSNYLGKFRTLIFANSVLSTVDREQVFKYMANQNGIALKNLLWFTGNSLAFGTNSTTGHDPMTDLLGSLGATWTGTNFGVAGQSTPEMIANDPAKIDGLYRLSRPHNVLYAWEFVNDYSHTPSTTAQAFANMQTYCAARKAAAAALETNLIIIIGKMLSQGAVGSPTESDRMALSALVDAQPLGPYWDGVANFDLDPQLTGVNVWLNTTYYSTDKIHLTDAGYVIASARIYSTMQAMGLA